jgi:hypothetical protein
MALDIEITSTQIVNIEKEEDDFSFKKYVL